VSWVGLARPLGAGLGAIPGLLQRLRAVQLDPLEPIGSQADLVALARLDGLARGDVYRGLLPGHAFEHYAKERCLLPADAFPQYRRRATGDVGWRLSDLHKALPPSLLDDVEAEVRERGPLAPAALTDRGRVQPVDWSGWKGTSKASTMALEALSLRCRVVVSGRSGRDKLYDVPERALPAHHARRPRGDFDRWAILDRATAAGLLPTRSGPQWGCCATRGTQLAPRLVETGALRAVALGGRTWWCRPEFLEAPIEEPDDRVRILGPLDPLLWDRDLVRLVFGFDYVWEVYKPAAERTWGWYVVPLLYEGRLVGRLEARYGDGKLTVHQLWPESPGSIPGAALDRALDRHERALQT
jgi:uncharacterized protein YcaQ